MARVRRPTLAISGQGAPGHGPAAALAEECGRLAALRGATVLTGGLGGVMAAAARGARRAGGTVVSVLPSDGPVPEEAEADLALRTGVGEARDLVLVASADAVIAIGGGWGTLAEIALARKLGRPVVLLESWRVCAPADWDSGASLPSAATPAEAVELALGAAA